MRLEHDPRLGRFDIQSEGLRPPMRQFAIGDRMLHIFGHPIANGRRSDDDVMSCWDAASDTGAFARGLDGNFLLVIHDHRRRTLEIVSDRFSSHALYFATRAGSLVASFSLIGLIRELGGFQPNIPAFVEFLHFRRLFGEKTYDSRCQYLASATLLQHAGDGLSATKYWQPDYRRPRLNAETGSAAIVEALRGTMRAHMEDVDSGRRYALFMSGGLDSRALVAASADPPVCVTTCLQFNNEAEVARDVATAAHTPFHFVPRPTNAYDGHVADAIYSGNGEHILSEAHFIGYRQLVGSYADCFFLGLGLDVFLGGLYLPKDPVRWGGRDALHSALRPLGADIVGAFIDGVKYRLKTSDPWDIVKADARPRLRDGLRQGLDQIASRGREYGASGYDLWEHMHLHNFSRHYSFLMIDSVRRWAECRVPALCNDLLDIAIALPAELKTNSTAYLQALKRLSPDLMRIRNANTNIAAGVSLRQQSAVRAARVVANKFGAGFRVSPSRADRSWPSPANVLQSSSELMNLVGPLPASPNLAALDLFDPKALAAKVDDHMSGRSDESVLLMLLVTVDGFLKQVH
jgi:asparagine synthetase B (glutamine-hydrolysing)